MADFSLLQTPNFSGALLSGYQAGQAYGRQRQLDTALSQVDLERPETIIPILRADPTTGAALLGSSLKLSEQRHELAKSAAIGDALTSYFGSQGSGGTGSAPPAGTLSVPAIPASSGIPAAMAPAVTPADPNQEVVITGRRAPHPNAGQAIAAMVNGGASLEDAQKFVGIAGSLDEQGRKTLADSQDALGNVAQQLSSIPYEQRKAHIAQLTPYLLSHHVTQGQIDGFDPTDQNISGLKTEALGVKETLAQLNSDRTFKLDNEKFAHTVSNDAIQNHQGEQRIGLEAGNLNVSKQRLSDEEKGIIGGKGGQTGLPPVQQRLLPDGTHAYRNPANGKWYDNPEFK